MQRVRNCQKCLMPQYSPLLMELSVLQVKDSQVPVNCTFSKQCTLLSEHTGTFLLQLVLTTPAHPWQERQTPL